ncbi:MAG: hypothetical protein V2A74_01495 [bacterium]
MTGSEKICREMRELIEESSAQKLVEIAKRPEVAGHLESCAGCRASYEKALALGRALDQWAAPQPKKNIQAHVMARIAQIERERGSRRETSTFGDLLVALLGYRLRVPALAAVAVVGFLVGSLVLNIAQWSQPKPSVQIASPVAAPAPLGTAVVKSVRSITQPTATPLESMLPSIQYATTTPMLGSGAMNLTAGAYYPAIVVILGAPPMAAGQELMPLTYPSNMTIKPKS